MKTPKESHLVRFALLTIIAIVLNNKNTIVKGNPGKFMLVETPDSNKTPDFIVAEKPDGKKSLIEVDGETGNDEITQSRAGKCPKEGEVCESICCRGSSCKYGFHNKCVKNDPDTMCKGGPIAIRTRRSAIESRACGLLIKGFTYNKDTFKCEPFAKVGCAMSGNGFVSKKDCEATCIFY